VNPAVKANIRESTRSELENTKSRTNPNKRMPHVKTSEKRETPIVLLIFMIFDFLLLKIREETIDETIKPPKKKERSDRKTSGIRREYKNPLEEGMNTKARRTLTNTLKRKPKKIIQRRPGSLKSLLYMLETVSSCEASTLQLAPTEPSNLRIIP
jgi:hypothetical protein